MTERAGRFDDGMAARLRDRNSYRIGRRLTTGAKRIAATVFSHLDCARVNKAAPVIHC
jgi:hypothetical protein